MVMDVLEAMRNRRSVRKYLADPVPADVLDRLLEAAQWAPSWAHTQCVEVVVVDDPDIRARLQATMTDKNPAYRAILEAPLIVAFLAKTGRAGFKKGEPGTRRGDWMMFDAGLCMENFMVAAHAEGLATVCIGLFDDLAAAQALALPEGVEVVALTPLGYPDQTPNVPPRKERAVFAHRNRHGNPL
jgi:nitroreductase